MEFHRLLNLSRVKGSCFLFGPRMTGKTHLLKLLDPALYIDLLDPEAELAMSATPMIFWQQLNSLRKGDLVIVDEVQRLSVLLDYVQKGIEEKGLKFILSGSSARKLRRGGANLLGGRALDLRLHPLTCKEIGEKFRVEKALEFGTLPKIVTTYLENEPDECRRLLKAYATVYIKEEVQAEALTRNVAAFQRFLSVAAVMNAQTIEFSTISRESSVPMSTVKEYFSILEDTLLGEFFWPWDRSERKKARPKFYFFDCGVVRALQNRLFDPPTPQERGLLFETFVYNELKRLRDYHEKPYEFAFWREGEHEIDLMVLGPKGPLMAFECKTSRETVSQPTLMAFRKKFPHVPLYVISYGIQQQRKLDNGLILLPWHQAFDLFIK